VPSYYLRYFYAHDEVAQQQQRAPTRAAEVTAIEDELLRLYADPALDVKPEALTRRGGAFYSEAAVALLASLLSSGGATPTERPIRTPRNGRPFGVVPSLVAPPSSSLLSPGTTGAPYSDPPLDIQVVNMRNNGTLPFLPDEAVIEGPAVIDSGGPSPVPAAPVPPLLRGLIAHVSAYEELAVDAALRGGRDRVAAALLAHPLIGQFGLAQDMADRLIAENAGFLSWA
jgi:6-phospho-beta-glucosidase